MYRLHNTTLTYTSRRGHRVTAIDSVSLAIQRGEFVAITGPSGSGKSTLLLALGGMLAPDSGTLLFEGEALYQTAPRARAAIRNRKIGMVFQTFNLIPYLTAQENIELPLFLAGSKAPGQATRAKALLEEVGLADRADHLPAELSVGQQQRVALARMLATDPDTILADEPTGSLDPETGAHILDFLEGCHRAGKTIILITHDPDAAARAERSLRLQEGKFV